MGKFKEKYNQIIKEVYGKYLDYLNEHQIYGTWYDDEKSFEKECKANKEFAKIWGLKIDERELSLEERSKLAPENNIMEVRDNLTILGFDCDDDLHSFLDKHNVPRKFLTYYYKDETIEVYE